MNEIVNKLLLLGDKFMPEMHLKQPDFTYCPWTLFTKNKERIEKLMQAGNTEYICKNDLDKACFQHDMAYVKFKDLNKRIQSDKFLRDKVFEIAINPKYDRYRRGSGIKNKIKENQQVTNVLHKPIIRNVKKRKEKFIHHLKTIFGV